VTPFRSAVHRRSKDGRRSCAFFSFFSLFFVEKVKEIIQEAAAISLFPPLLLTFLFHIFARDFSSNGGCPIRGMRRPTDPSVHPPPPSFFLLSSTFRARASFLQRESERYQDRRSTFPFPPFFFPPLFFRTGPIAVPPAGKVKLSPQAYWHIAAKESVPTRTPPPFFLFFFFPLLAHCSRGNAHPSFLGK